MHVLLQQAAEEHLNCRQGQWAAQAKHHMQELHLTWRHNSSGSSMQGMSITCRGIMHRQQCRCRPGMDRSAMFGSLPGSRSHNRSGQTDCWLLIGLQEGLLAVVGKGLFENLIKISSPPSFRTTVMWCSRQTQPMLMLLVAETGVAMSCIPRHIDRVFVGQKCNSI